MPGEARVGTMAGTYTGSNDRPDFLDRSLNAQVGTQDRPGTGSMAGPNQVFNPFQTEKMQEPLNYSHDAPRQPPLQPPSVSMQQQEPMQSNKAATLYGTEQQFSQSLAPHRPVAEPEQTQPHVQAQVRPALQHREVLNSRNTQNQPRVVDPPGIDDDVSDGAAEQNHLLVASQYLQGKNL